VHLTHINNRLLTYLLIAHVVSGIQHYALGVNRIRCRWDIWKLKTHIPPNSVYKDIR